MLIDRQVRSEPGPISQRPALLQAAAETTACTGEEDLKAVCRVRHYKEVGLQEWRLAAQATVQRVKRCRSSHFSLSRNDSFKKFTGARSCRPHHSHFSHGRQNRRSSFCLGRGDNFVTITRFGKPLFADMHHRVYALAGALRKPNIPYPHPDVSTGTGWMASVMVM